MWTSKNSLYMDNEKPILAAFNSDWELLSKPVLCKHYMDICICPCIPYEGEEGRTHVLLVPDFDSLDKDIIFEKAINNVKDSFIITELSSVINSLLKSQNADDDDYVDNGTYVVQSSKSDFGAAALYFPDIFKELAEKHGDLWLLPSSIHEIIAVPVASYDMTIEELGAMVTSINESLDTRGTGDFLSDNVYRYLKGLNDIVVCV